jgi:hypothetical protein
MADHAKCAKCDRPHDGWPGDDGELCQMCWEDACSESWWKMITTLPQVPVKGTENG